MARISREELRRQGEKLNRSLLKKFKSQYDKVISSGEFLDEDGYPTDDVLTLIEIWHWSDTKGFFDFIKSIWHLADWGWYEEDGGKDLFLNEELTTDIHRYHISTAGWSGNESIIRSMQKNIWLWHNCWVQSRRGGHYIFELKTETD